MGITINGNNNVSAGIRGIVDDLGMLEKSLHNTGVVLARAVSYAVAEACAENTPVDSGNMLQNWHIGTGDESQYDDSYLADSGKEGREARKAAYLPEVESRVRAEAMGIDSGEINHITVYNNAPYAAKIEDDNQIFEYAVDAAEAVLDEFSQYGAVAVSEFDRRAR